MNSRNPRSPYKAAFQIQSKWSRTELVCPRAVPSGLSTSSAESMEDLEFASRLMHDFFVEQGLIVEEPSRVWITKFHALPATQILTVSHHGRIAAAMGFLPKSAFGLPVEKQFHLPLLPPALKIAQITPVAVHQDFKDRSSEIRLSLLRYAYHLCISSFKVSHLITVADADSFSSFQSIFDLVPLKRKQLETKQLEKDVLRAGLVDIRKYENLNPDFLLFVQQPDTDLNTEPDTDLNTEPDADPNTKLHTEPNTEHLRFPDGLESRAQRPDLSLKSSRFAFCEKHGLFQRLNDFEKLILSEIYSHCQELKVTSNVRPTRDLRREPRYEIRMHATLSSGLAHAEIQNVALHGLGGLMSAQVPLGKCQFHLDLGSGVQMGSDFGLGSGLESGLDTGLGSSLESGLGLDFGLGSELDVGGGTILCLEGQILWQSPQGHFGFAIERPPYQWKVFIEKLQSAVAPAS